MVFFLCKDKGISVIYHGVALQHEPLRADAPKREQVHFLRYYGSERVASYESPWLRQSKPKSNTRVFGLGFSFAKFRFYLRFSVVGVPSFWFFGVRRLKFVSLCP